MKYFYVALCVVSQEGDDNDADPKRVIVASEAVYPPSQDSAEAFEKHHKLVGMLTHARRAFA